MKKWLLVLSCFTLLTLSACGSAELEAREVFEKSMQAMEEVNSFALTMDIEQLIEENGASFQMDITMDGEMTLEPLVMYQQMSLAGMGLPATEMEMYVSEENVYFFDGMSEEWFKMPEEVYAELIAVQDIQSNPSQELEKLAEYVEELNLTEEDTYYILELSASGDAYKLFVEDIVSEFELTDELFNEMFENMTINQLQYVMKIDKETYYTTEIEVKLDFTFEMDGESATIIQDLRGIYSRYNEIDEIVIPNDVLENAIELGF